MTLNINLWFTQQSTWSNKPKTQKFFFNSLFLFQLRENPCTRCLHACTAESTLWILSALPIARFRLWPKQPSQTPWNAFFMLVALSVVMLDKWSFVMLHSCSMFSKNSKMSAVWSSGKKQLWGRRTSIPNLERGNALWSWCMVLHYHHCWSKHQ